MYEKLAVQLTAFAAERNLAFRYHLFSMTGLFEVEFWIPLHVANDNSLPGTAGF